MLNVAEFTLFNRFPMSDPKLFPDLNDTDSHVTEVESLCVQCEEQVWRCGAVARVMCG